MRERDWGVVVRVLGRLVLDQQADWLPDDVDVAVRLYFVDHPTGGHPAPRSNGVDPEFDVHRAETTHRSRP